MPETPRPIRDPNETPNYEQLMERILLLTTELTRSNSLISLYKGKCPILFLGALIIVTCNVGNGYELNDREGENDRKDRENSSKRLKSF
jgi:hypothetical protein